MSRRAARVNYAALNSRGYASDDPLVDDETNEVSEEGEPIAEDEEGKHNAATRHSRRPTQVEADNAAEAGGASDLLGPARVVCRRLPVAPSHSVRYQPVSSATHAVLNAAAVAPREMARAMAARTLVHRRVMLQGLAQNPEYDGRAGTVRHVELSASSTRIHVELDPHFPGGPPLGLAKVDLANVVPEELGVPYGHPVVGHWDPHLCNHVHDLQCPGSQPFLLELPVGPIGFSALEMPPHGFSGVLLPPPPHPGPFTFPGVAGAAPAAPAGIAPVGILPPPGLMPPVADVGTSPYGVPLVSTGPDEMVRKGVVGHDKRAPNSLLQWKQCELPKHRPHGIPKGRKREALYWHTFSL